MRSSLLLLLLFTMAQATQIDSLIAVQKRLKVVKERYSKLTTELQLKTENRWSIKEQQVSAKEQKGATQKSLDEQFRKLTADLDGKRQQLIAKKRTLDSLSQCRIALQKEGKTDSNLLQNVKKQYKNSLSEVHPSRREAAILKYQQLETKLSGDLFTQMGILQKDIISELQTHSEISIKNRRIVTAGGVLKDAQVLALGDHYSWALTGEGELFYLFREKPNKQQWLPMESGAHDELVAAFGESREGPIGTLLLPIDILQNNYSVDLIVGNQQTAQDKIKSYFKAGGILLYPLGGLLLIAIILIINRLYYYAQRHRKTIRFMDRVEQVLAFDDEKEIKNLCKGRGLLPRILHKVFDHRHVKRSMAEKIIKEELLREAPALDKHVSTLAVLAGAAPLLGLLGTVSGMIRMFDTITAYGNGDPKLLAGGISEALVTTQVGLSIAIPLLLVHTLLQNKRNKIQAELEMFAMVILNRLWPEE